MGRQHRACVASEYCRQRLCEVTGIAIFDYKTGVA